MRRLRTHKYMVTFAAAILSLAALAGCGESDGSVDESDPYADRGVGKLSFYADGGDAAREGLFSVDGWQITFEHVWVNVSEFTAYQEPIDSDDAAKHFGHPHEDIPDEAAHETLPVTDMIDLVAGDAPVWIDEIGDAPAGNYNFVNFTIEQAGQGDFAGYAMVLSGVAHKGSRVVNFDIPIAYEMRFTECEHHADDPHAGVVESGGEGQVTLTMHLDHLFGDGFGNESKHQVNTIALGFEPFAQAAQAYDGQIDMIPAKDLLSPDLYAVFLAALEASGHAGDGHCRVVPTD